jgi:hypothetical protein
VTNVTGYRCFFLDMAGGEALGRLAQIAVPFFTGSTTSVVQKNFRAGCLSKKRPLTAQRYHNAGCDFGPQESCFVINRHLCQIAFLGTPV